VALEWTRVDYVRLTEEQVEAEPSVGKVQYGISGQPGIALVCRTCRTRGAPSSV
jgi:hypothetical protein